VAAIDECAIFVGRIGPGQDDLASDDLSCHLCNRITWRPAEDTVDLDHHVRANGDAASAKGLEAQWDTPNEAHLVARARSRGLAYPHELCAAR
jgi:hypothetical protein